MQSTTAVCSSLVWWWILLVTCPGLPSGRPDDWPPHDPPIDQGEDVVASTVSGRLRGRTARVTAGRVQVYMFLGVPYARPPVRGLRFHAPLPHEPWTGVRNATQHGAHCAQNIPQDRRFYHSIPLFMPHDRISEDCLFLDVYTPTMGTSARLAVMFFIHGGGLFSGSGAQYDGRALAAMGNIVVVIINYRLGILGFSGIGGQWNVGFLDQISALRWVQHNIHVFGGDPGRVTIAGQSAGGGSVGWLVLSPLTAGLFRRAISQSGAATTIPTQNTDYTMHVCFLLSDMCTRPSPSEEFECLNLGLRNASAEDFANQTRRGRPPAPAVDGFFLPDQPRTLLKNGSARNIEYLMGVTNHELGHAISQDWDFSGEEDRDQIRSIINAGYRKYFQCINEQTNGYIDVNKFISNSLLDLYMAEQDPLMQISGDMMFTVPTVNTAWYRTDTPVYLYEFQHRPSWHHSKPGHVKADHGDELLFVFGAPFFDWPRNPADPAWRLNFTEEERVLSRKIMTYWTNFVKTGDPNRGDTEPTSTFDLETWPRYSREDQEYIQLDLDISTAHRLKEEKVKLINDMLMCSNSSVSLSKLEGTWTITTLCLLMLFLYHGRL
ncbi:cocaine esterase-like [Branchiostoma floridae x Branchiostoma japonicum]